MSTKKFDSVWDALEDDPVKREIYKLRSDLLAVPADVRDQPSGSVSGSATGL